MCIYIYIFNIYIYIYAGPSIEGPPGCEAYVLILHPASYVSLYPCIYILLFLYPVCCMLYTVSWMQQSGYWIRAPRPPGYHQLESFLESWLPIAPQDPPQTTRITINWAVSWNPGSLYPGFSHLVVGVWGPAAWAKP